MNYLTIVKYTNQKATFDWHQTIVLSELKTFDGRVNVVRRQC
jgi:hypothetical protein